MSTNQQTISLGVIGVGAMGQHHARIAASLPGVHLAGVADANIQQAQAVASRHGVQAYQEYADILDHVDAVSIAAPTALHHHIGMECLKHGVHILMEKPLAANVREAKELAQAAASAGKILQVGHVERFNPTFTEMAKVLSRKKVVALEARRLSPFVPRAADVSAVFDLMVHDIDLVLKLADSPVAKIGSVGLQAKVSNIDHASAHIVFENGVIASLTASKISQQKVRELTAICDDCVVQADLLARTVVIYRQATSHYLEEKDQILYRQEGLVEQVYVPMVEPLHAEIEHFAHCVRSGEKPQVSAEDAIQVIEVAEAIERCAQATILSTGGAISHTEVSN